nr:DUF2812 domain-containing protein [Desulfosporosinus hippei]
MGRNESWFSGMARKGLHLKKIGRLFVYFEKGEPKETKYRIDYLKEAPSQEQLDVYHDCGWNFIAKNGYFYVFSAYLDNQVVHITYYGEEGIEDIIPPLAQKMKEVIP